MTPGSGNERALTRALRLACDISAGIGGLALIVMASVTVISVLGRALFSSPIQGDVELVQLGCAIVVGSFLPYTQFRHGNIIVDFFTTRASEATQARLDRFGALLVGLAMALLSWRSAVGGLSAWQSQASSMMVGFPEWVVYAFIVPSLALAAVIGIAQALFGFGAEGASQ